MNPETKVFVWFDLSATGGDFFTLDHPTKGKLDGVTFKLAGDLQTDVTADWREISFTRGRSRELDAIPASTGSVRFVNVDRDYDPFHATSPYVGNLVPGKRIRVETNGVAIFDGSIEDWKNSYQLGELGQATVVLGDALTKLARKRFSAWTTTSQAPGARISAVLDRTEVASTANRDIDAGVETLQADNVSFGSNVLNYLQLVNQSDSGRLFASRDGVLTFRDRTTVLNSMTAVTFRDSDPGVRFRDVEFEQGSTLLFNRVTVDREGGTAQTVSDADSQKAYDIRALSVTGLLLNTDAQSLALAQYLLNLYKQPEQRVSQIVIQLPRLTAAQQADVLALEIGSLVRAVFTPSGVGSPIDRYLLVEGIQHQIPIDNHTVTLSLGAADTRTFLQLDEPEFGKLSSGNLLAF